MVDYKVLIPTAGLGSRLQSLTTKTNKSLLSVSDKPIISHIIDSYPDSTEFVVAIGYFGDHVKQYLELVYPKRSIQCVDIDKYDALDGNVVYSIQKCSQHLQCPFIFHACDSLVEFDLDAINQFDYDWILGCFGYDSTLYRSIRQLDSGFISLCGKGESNYDYLYTGVCGIYNYDLYWKICNQLLAEKPGNCLSDCDILQHFTKLVLHLTNCWYDTGNLSGLKRVRELSCRSLPVLEKQGENIFLVNNQVIKYFSDSHICIDRICRSRYLNGLTPPLTSSSDNFYSYKFIDAVPFSKSLSSQYFKYLLSWSQSLLWIPIDSNNYSQDTYDFYYSKTISRINQFLKLHPSIDHIPIINNIAIPSIHDIILNVNFSSLASSFPTSFHGDFILDNILFNYKSFILIDWRHRFGSSLYAGDFHYDLAKLNHSLFINNETINSIVYRMDSNNSVICTISPPSIFSTCLTDLIEYCQLSSIDYNKITTLTSLIWINMAPLHSYPLNHFLFLYGKYSLWKNML